MSTQTLVLLLVIGAFEFAAVATFGAALLVLEQRMALAAWWLDGFWQGAGRGRR